jgi:sugar/nucleoside kinase (ribokinase family)
MGAIQSLLLRRRPRGRGDVVLCIGDPVLDVVCVDCSSSLISSLGFDVGGCDLIEEAELARLLQGPLRDHTKHKVPGGSAANFAKCLARLSGSGEDCLDQTRHHVVFSGTLGGDEMGLVYKNAMEACGVNMGYASIHPHEANGLCLCLVSSGSGERTMRTCLRASRNHSLESKYIDKLRPAWTHFEGYYVHKPGILQTMEALKRQGSKISFDLASVDVISMHMQLFDKILSSSLIDVLFCNEDEALAFFDMKNEGVESLQATDVAAYLEESASQMTRKYKITMVISRGGNGCIATSLDVENYSGRQFKCLKRASSAADDVQVVDTIGAGDHFSAGFVFALLSGGSLDTACRCGCIAGGVAVETAGATIEEGKMKRLRETLKQTIANYDNIQRTI